MIKLGVTAAVSEPGTTATTTTGFSRFLHGTAFGAYQRDCRRRGCSIVCTCRDCSKHCLVFAKIYLYDVSFGLTFAGIKTLRPHVTGVFVASISAILIPSTTRSATTDSAGFLERATLWAHLIGFIGRGDG